MESYQFIIKLPTLRDKAIFFRNNLSSRKTKKIFQSLMINFSYKVFFQYKNFQKEKYVIKTHTCKRSTHFLSFLYFSTLSIFFFMSVSLLFFLSGNWGTSFLGDRENIEKEEKLKNVVIPISSHVFGECFATLPTLSNKVNCSVAGLLLGLISVTCGNCSESNILDFTISVNCNSCILSF